VKRFVVAHVCLDSDGKYSIDAPGPDQGGTMGFGTSSVENGELEGTMRLLEATLKSWHEIMFHIVRSKGGT
jgi:hypothetical protein